MNCYCPIHNFERPCKSCSEISPTNPLGSEFKQIGVIDFTPTWTNLVLQLAEVYSNGGNDNARAMAKAELLRMARLADGVKPLTDCNNDIEKLTHHANKPGSQLVRIRLRNALALGEFGSIVNPK